MLVSSSKWWRYEEDEEMVQMIIEECEIDSAFEQNNSIAVPEVCSLDAVSYTHLTRTSINWLTMTNGQAKIHK